MSNRFNINPSQPQQPNPFENPPKAADVFKDELAQFDQSSTPNMASLAPEAKPMEQLTRGQAWDLIEKKMAQAEEIVAQCQRIANYHALELEKELVSVDDRRNYEWNHSGCSF